MRYHSVTLEKSRIIRPKPLMFRVLGPSETCRMLTHSCINFELDFGVVACE